MKKILLLAVLFLSFPSFIDKAAARDTGPCGPRGDECYSEAAYYSEASYYRESSYAPVGHESTDPNCSYPDYRIVNGERVPCAIKSLPGLVGLFTKLFQVLFGIFAVLGSFTLLYAAFLYMQSEGNPEKAAESRRMIVYAIIALVISVFAWGLPRVIIALL